MYLTYYALAFALFAIPKDNRFVWLSLCVLCVLLKCNTLVFDVSDSLRYIARTSLICVFAHILLFRFSKLSCYQSFILFLFLAANFALLYDVANKKHILIYNNFEAVIYGLVACQFIGFIPKVWNIIYNWYTNRFNSHKNQFMVEKS